MASMVIDRGIESAVGVGWTRFDPFATMVVVVSSAVLVSPLMSVTSVNETTGVVVEAGISSDGSATIEGREDRYGFGRVGMARK